jgi:transcriptional regulator with XRE-family HTH domain
MSEISNLQGKALMATVRKLRTGLGDTLQEFSERLGLGMASVVRYERNRIPRGKALVRLEAVATATGFTECAAVFRKAMDVEFAVPTPASGSPPIQFRNADEAELVKALLDAIRQDWRYAKEAKAVRTALRPVLAQRRREAEEVEARDMQGNAIVRLLESGRSVEDVMRVFRTDIEAVADAFFRYGGAKAIEARMIEVVGALLKAHWSIRQMADRFGGEDAGSFLGCAQDLEAFEAIGEYYDEEKKDRDNDDAE